MIGVMGDVLSQNEIDSLLAALSSGELDVEEMQEKDEKQVKNYDFSRPAKFSKEHLRTLGMIFERAGKCSEFGNSNLCRIFKCIIEPGITYNCQLFTDAGQYYYGTDQWTRLCDH